MHLFVQIPEAACLLGMCMGNIAAALASLGKWEKSLSAAQECLPLVKNEPLLWYTTAAALQTIGSCEFLLGRQNWRSYYEASRSILKSKPDDPRSSFLLGSLDRNENTFARGRTGKRWWEFWRS